MALSGAFAESIEQLGLLLPSVSSRAQAERRLRKLAESSEATHSYLGRCMFWSSLP